MFQLEECPVNERV